MTAMQRLVEGERVFVNCDEDNNGVDQYGTVTRWSTFAYIETVCVDKRGVPSKVAMRCHNGRHPFHAHEGGDASQHPTRLRDGSTIPDHDDWDCLDDLVAAGLLESIGTAVNPRYSLTTAGFKVAAAIRAHKAAGGSLKDFNPRGAV